MKKWCLVMALLMALVVVTGAASVEGLPELPNIPAASTERLNAAANAEGGTLVFNNADEPMIWPMLPAEEDGYVCLTSTNWGKDDSVAAVYTSVEAQAGDALSFWYKTSTEVGFDLMQICVNGDVVKVFTGEGDWSQYAIAFPEEGAYEVSFRYSKDTVSAEGSDAVYLRDVQLLTGDAAQAALAANPVYPVGAERTLTIYNADAREIVLDDPTFAMTSIYGLARYFIVPEDEVALSITLPAGADPDGEVLVVSGESTRTYSVAQGASAEGYAFAVPLERGVTYVQLLPARDCNAMDVRAVICFSDVYWADELLRVMQNSGYQVRGWRYVEQDACTLTVIDQHGEFLEGVTVSVLTADGVELLNSDQDGQISFAINAGQSCIVHIVDAPEGYAYDLEQSWQLDAENPEAIIDLTRLEN